MPHLIDTDISSYYLKGNDKCKERFNRAGAGNIWISRITVIELQVLAYRRHDPSRLLSDIDDLISRYDFVDLDNRSWELFGKIKAKVLSSGSAPGESGDFDILQACIARAKKFTIVTNNENHFDSLGVQLENWAK